MIIIEHCFGYIHISVQFTEINKSTVGKLSIVTLRMHSAQGGSLVCTAMLIYKHI